MAKKCKPGIICIENTTLFIILLLIGFIMYLVYSISLKSVHIERNIIRDNQPNSEFYNIHNPNLIRSTISDDVYTNPYAPPLKNNIFNNPTNVAGDIRRIPINTKTSFPDVAYTQIGIATRDVDGDTILPVFGRPISTNRNKWQYYTLTERNIKLPISRSGRSCTATIGCDELFNGESIYVEGYKDVFHVTIYENNDMQYIPYI